jgi:hypothetical protein
MTVSNSYPHVIRLLGPWEYQWMPRRAEGPSVGTGPQSGQPVAQPPQQGARAAVARLQLTSSAWTWESLIEPQAAGQLRLARAFHVPTGLDSDERVWLVVDGADPSAEVLLNGQRLGATPGYAQSAPWDITDRLSPRNRVELHFQLPPDSTSTLRPGRNGLPGGLLAPVRLEIRCRQFLSHLAVFPEGQNRRPRLIVRGRVGGCASSVPLHVRVVAERRELAFHRLAGAADFCLALDASLLDAAWAPGRGGTALQVHVDLLGGGQVVWSESRTTALRSLCWENHGPLRVAGQAVAVATASPCSAQGASMALAQATAASAAALSFVPTDDWLAQADQCGAPLAIYVPSAWAHEVCPRLAHHPSIVAWWSDVPPAAMPGGNVPEGYYGRPWIDRPPAGNAA